MKRCLLACLLWCIAQNAMADPAIWSVQGRHNTLYLLGSVHFLPADQALPANIATVYRQAEMLLMEIDMDDLDMAQTQQTMLTLGLLPPGDSLRQRLDGRAYAKLQQLAGSLGLDAAMLDRFQPWLAALTLEQLQLARMGLQAESGVEQQLLLMAKKDRKEISGLETLQQQIEILAGFSAEQQRQLLLYSLDDMEQSDAQVQALVAAWRDGDVAALERQLQAELRDFPQIYRALTVERNRRWLTVLKPLLEQSRDDYLVAVGALHLVGDDSVLELLRQAGYRVMRRESGEH